MLITKEKSPTTSINYRAVSCEASAVNAKRAPARSAAQLVEETCAEMIQNLKRNVAGRIARSVL